MSQMSLEKRFGQSAVFVASTLMENGGVPQSATPESLLKEAIHVISCGYEDKTDWGSEVWIYLPLRPLIYVGFSIYHDTIKYLYLKPRIISIVFSKVVGSDMLSLAAIVCTHNFLMNFSVTKGCLTFGGADWMDLWFCHRRYFDRVQDACPWLEINLLHPGPSRI